MGLNAEQRREIKEFAGDLEKKFNVGCAVVNNRWAPFRHNGAALCLFLFPCGSEDEEEFNLQTEMAFEYYRESPFSRTWNCTFSSLYDALPWFTRFVQRKGEFPLKDMAAGAGLISSVIFGKERMLDLRKKAEEFFGEGIIEFWKVEADRRLKERNKKIREMSRKEIIYRRERKKLLNRHELEELKRFVFFIFQKYGKEEISLIVALDGSGHPIGKALEWFGIGCPVAYLDPHYIKTAYSRNSEGIKLVIGILRKEFPEIFAALSKNPREVLFVDDQTGYGNTCKSISRLVGCFSGNSESSLNFAAMTPYLGNNTPSWLRRRDVQGLKIAPEGSLCAVEISTPQSRWFYGRLKKEVLGWKK